MGGRAREEKTDLLLCIHTYMLYILFASTYTHLYIKYTALLALGLARPLNQSVTIATAKEDLMHTRLAWRRLAHNSINYIHLLSNTES